MKKLIYIILICICPVYIFAQQFSVQKNGTVIDKATNLMWMQKDYDAYEGKHLPRYTWNEANEWCKSINKAKFAGHNDWRMPTVSELKSIFRAIQAESPKKILA